MRPFPNMPYGLAPAWCFPTFECAMYLLFILCLVYAAKKGRRDVVYLFGGLAFGLILEYINVIANMGYSYGRFMVMFGHAPVDIPLCIGVGWGIIMYSARLFTDRLGLTVWACAALDTLLAVNIDLSMDTVAYRMHMWHWHWDSNVNPLTANWFGIPYGNFFGWQIVVFFYSLFSRLFERQMAKKPNTPVLVFVATAVLALLCSQIFLFTMEEYIEGFLYKTFGITSFHRFITTMIVLIVIVAFNWRKRVVALAEKIPAVAWWVPAFFHLYFFACLFLVGFYLENKWMTIAACVNLVVGVWLHVGFKPKVHTGLNSSEELTA